MQKDRVLGLATYSHDDWKRLLDISDDRDYLEETWDEWNDNLHKYETQLKTMNQSFEEINIDINELIQFCNINNLCINGESRSMFVVEKLIDQNIR